jgi:hypothetical protein
MSKNSSHQLGSCIDDLVSALMAARAAREDLEDTHSYARITRADQLVEKIADMIAFTERLAFVCEADARYDEARQARS